MMRLKSLAEPGAKEVGFEEGIFLAEREQDRFGVLDARRHVPDKRAFFFRAVDQLLCVAVLSLRTERKIREMKNAQGATATSIRVAWVYLQRFSIQYKCST